MRWVVEVVLGAASFVAALGLVLPTAPEAVPPRVAAPRSTPVIEPDASVLTASYTLQAKLDAEKHRVEAEGTIDFVNTSRAPLRSLFFHLYLNAFKNDRTLFMRSPFGVGRSAARAEEYGYVDVKKLHARELPGVDLWASRSAHSPSDPEDETDIEVPLPRALEPGERLTLEIAFESQLPTIVERTGRAGSFHFVGQWFPKLARLEEDGTFAHFPFHTHAEFYADFGRYDVTLDVPIAFTVGASGERVAQRLHDGRRVERYTLPRAHDFAWTAWDGYRESEAAIDGVAVRFLFPPGNEANVARSEDAIAMALPYFGARYGRYPYKTLTVVHPPEAGGSAGGMEYPSLITTGGPWYTAHAGVRGIEAVTIHELGHQWFYGLVATNEANAPFLDEGLTSFAELASMSDWLGGASGADVLGVRASVWSAYRAFSADRVEDEIIGKPAADFSSFQNLGALVYGRTAVVFETLARVFGRERLDRALRDYAESFRFGHPTAADLLAKIESHLGAQARDALEQALFARGRVNYVVREITSARNRSPAGFFERSSGRERVVPAPEPPPGYTSRAIVYRHGALELPVDVVLIADDGAEKREHWDGRGTFRIFDYQGKRPLSRVIIDPEQRILIDDDLFDNHATVMPASLPRVNERLAFLAALALGGPLP